MLLSPSKYQTKGSLWYKTCFPQKHHDCCSPTSEPKNILPWDVPGHTGLRCIPGWARQQCAQQGLESVQLLFHRETAFACPNTVSTPRPATQPKEGKNYLFSSGNWLLVSSFSPSTQLLAGEPRAEEQCNCGLQLKDAQQLWYTSDNFHSWQRLDTQWPLLILYSLERPC